MPVSTNSGRSGGSAACRVVRTIQIGAALCLALAMAGLGLALLLGALALLVLALVVAGLLFPRELRWMGAAWRDGSGLFGEWLDIFRPETARSAAEPEETRKNAPEAARREQAN